MIVNIVVIRCQNWWTLMSSVTRHQKQNPEPRTVSDSEDYWVSGTCTAYCAISREHGDGDHNKILKMIRIQSVPRNKISIPLSDRVLSRAGNEPSRSFKFYNHREGPY